MLDLIFELDSFQRSYFCARGIGVILRRACRPVAHLSKAVKSDRSDIVRIRA